MDTWEVLFVVENTSERKNLGALHDSNLQLGKA